MIGPSTSRRWSYAVSKLVDEHLALAYQESQWDARAESPNGARGIMMLMPETATEVGVRDLFDARESILGGARYFLKVLGQIPARIPEPDRTWFAIASRAEIATSSGSFLRRSFQRSSDQCSGR